MAPCSNVEKGKRHLKKLTSAQPEPEPQELGPAGGLQERLPQVKLQVAQQPGLPRRHSTPRQHAEHANGPEDHSSERASHIPVRRRVGRLARKPFRMPAGRLPVRKPRAGSKLPHDGLHTRHESEPTGQHEHNLVRRRVRMPVAHTLAGMRGAHTVDHTDLHSL